MCIRENRGRGVLKDHFSCPTHEVDLIMAVLSVSPRQVTHPTVYRVLLILLSSNRLAATQCTYYIFSAFNTSAATAAAASVEALRHIRMNRKTERSVGKQSTMPETLVGFDRKGTEDVLPIILDLYARDGRRLSSFTSC